MWPCVLFHTLDKHAYRTFNRAGIIVSPRVERLLGIESPLADQYAEQRRQFWIAHHYFPEDTVNVNERISQFVRSLEDRVQTLEAELAAERAKVADLQSRLNRWQRAVGDTLENRESLAILEETQ